MRPEKMFFLPALANGQQASLDGVQGMACTRSRRVMPGCILPLKRTSTDSGMSRASRRWRRRSDQTGTGGKGDTDGEAGVRVAASADGVRQQQRFSHEWITPSPRTQGHAAAVADEGWQFAVHLHVHWLGISSVWQNDCMTRSAEAQASQVLQLVTGHWAGGVFEPTIVVIAGSPSRCQDARLDLQADRQRGRPSSEPG